MTTSYQFFALDGEIHQFHIQVPAEALARIYICHTGVLAPGQQIIYQTLLEAEPLTFGKPVPIARRCKTGAIDTTLINIPLHAGTVDTFHFRLSGWDQNMTAERKPVVQRFRAHVDQGARILTGEEHPPRVVYCEETPEEDLRGCMRTEMA